MVVSRGKNKKQKRDHPVDYNMASGHGIALLLQQQQQKHLDIDKATSAAAFDIVAKTVYHCLVSKFKQEHSNTSLSSFMVNTGSSLNYPKPHLPVVQTNTALSGTATATQKNDTSLTDVYITVKEHNAVTLDSNYINFAEIFGRSTTIQSLTLWFNLSRGLLEGATIIHSLLYNRSIQHLCITDCLQTVTSTKHTIDDEDKRLIGTLLGVCTKHHPTLRRIEFTCNDSIDDTFFVPFLHQLQQGCNRNTIVQLDIDGCNLGNDGMNALGEMLIWNSTITDLMLASTVITDDGLQRISNTLRYQPSIRKLLMNLPNVTWDGGWVNVLTALKYNETLVDVTICYYSNNRIDEINHWSTLWNPCAKLFKCNDTVRNFFTMKLQSTQHCLRRGDIIDHVMKYRKRRRLLHRSGQDLVRKRNSTMKGSLRRLDINTWLLNYWIFHTLATLS